MKFDIDLLKGMKIKTMWSQNGDFDNLDQIRPASGKIVDAPEPEPPAEVADSHPDDEVGF
jgi:hypothetical protein